MPLRATLIQFGQIYRIGEPRPAEQRGLFEVTRALYNVDAERARGFAADMVILERAPKDDYDDQSAVIVFTECLAHSAIKTFHIPEN